MVAIQKQSVFPALIPFAFVNQGFGSGESNRIITIQRKMAHLFLLDTPAEDKAGAHTFSTGGCNDAFSSSG